MRTGREEWEGEGFTPDEQGEWEKVGVDNAFKAAWLKRQGLTPEILRRPLADFVSHMSQRSLRHIAQVARHTHK